MNIDQTIIEQARESISKYNEKAKIEAEPFSFIRALFIAAVEPVGDSIFLKHQVNAPYTRTARAKAAEEAVYTALQAQGENVELALCAQIEGYAQDLEEQGFINGFRYAFHMAKDVTTGFL